jgi:hypothetical protein
MPFPSPGLDLVPGRNPNIVPSPCSCPSASDRSILDSSFSTSPSGSAGVPVPVSKGDEPLEEPLEREETLMKDEWIENVDEFGDGYEYNPG